MRVEPAARERAPDDRSSTVGLVLDRQCIMATPRCSALGEFRAIWLGFQNQSTRELRYRTPLRATHTHQKNLEISSLAGSLGLVIFALEAAAGLV